MFLVLFEEGVGEEGANLVAHLIAGGVLDVILGVVVGGGWDGHCARGDVERRGVRRVCGRENFGSGRRTGLLVDGLSGG